MERVSALLLLLLCSLSVAELDNHEIREETKASPEIVNVSEKPQPCPSDIHAVLREMSTKLSELQCKMETLNQLQDKVEQIQILIQDHTVKLKELQVTGVDLLKDQLKELQTNQVDPLKEQLKDLQMNQVDPMKEQLKGQAGELNVIKSWTNATEHHVTSLRRDRAVRRVAFSASLLASGAGETGPFNTDTILVFRRVVSNIGNAYNPNTGFFIAPVRGAYHFEYYICGTMDGKHGSGAYLVKNGEKVFVAYEWLSGGYGVSANGATLLLEPGDVVFLLQWQNTRVFDDGNHHTTFSGHLLFPM